MARCLIAPHQTNVNGGFAKYEITYPPFYVDVITSHSFMYM